MTNRKAPFGLVIVAVLPTLWLLITCYVLLRTITDSKLREAPQIDALFYVYIAIVISLSSIGLYMLWRKNRRAIYAFLGLLLLQASLLAQSLFVNAVPMSVEIQSFWLIVYLVTVAYLILLLRRGTLE